MGFRNPQAVSVIVAPMAQALDEFAGGGLGRRYQPVLIQIRAGTWCQTV
jgi:hypothetical protein